MKSHKLNLVKKTILGLQRFLKKDDRICLVKFNQLAQKTSLMDSNSENWEVLAEKLRKLEGSGGTNISQGLACAFKALGERTRTNSVTSIFLLTDGQDQEPLRSMDEITNNFQKSKEANFTVKTFGFGDDHDASFLRQIA